MADGGPAANPHHSRGLPHADFDHPNQARVHDYLLGGSLNTPIDRMEGARIVQTNPHAALRARALRAFLGHAVEHMLDHGIHQFLDLGSGLPTCGATHILVHRRHPEARVVYVDVDPITVAHGQLLLRENPHATILRADIRDSASVLRHAVTSNLIDLAQPIGILVIDVLQQITEHHDPGAVLAGYTSTMPTASRVALTYPAQDHESGTSVADGVSSASAAISRWLQPMRPVSPGIAVLGQWINDVVLLGAQADLASIAVRDSYRVCGPRSPGR